MKMRWRGPSYGRISRTFNAVGEKAASEADACSHCSRVTGGFARKGLAEREFMVLAVSELQGGINPRCSCGSEMRRRYEAPTVQKLPYDDTEQVLHDPENIRRAARKTPEAIPSPKSEKQ